MTTPLAHYDAIYGPGRTLAADEALFVVGSPVESPRNEAEFVARLPCPLLIDGGEWRATGAALYMPATPVSVGERVMLRCRRLGEGS